MATMEARLADLITALGADFKRGAVPLVFSLTGSMSVRGGRVKTQLFGSGLIVSVKGWLETAPTGTTLFQADVLKNAATIYGTTANRPTWVSGSNAATVGSNSVTAYSNGDQISCDIKAVGNTVAGSDLTVTVWVLRTGE